MRGTNGIDKPDENRKAASEPPHAEIMTASEVARFLYCPRAYVCDAIQRKVDNAPP
jgi:hypothetical protein